MGIYTRALRDRCDGIEAVGGGWRVEAKVVPEAGKGTSAFINAMPQGFVRYLGDMVVPIHSGD